MRKLPPPLLLSERKHFYKTQLYSISGVGECVAIYYIIVCVILYIHEHETQLEDQYFFIYPVLFIIIIITFKVKRGQSKSV